MAKQRKQMVIDKKFQYSVAVKAVILPLVTVLLISGVLLYFSYDNDRKIKEINTNQAAIVDTFLSIPQLVDPQNQYTRDANERFQANLGKSREIQQNIRIVLYFLIIMTVVQTIIIFSLSISLTHRIAGPLYVMSKYLGDLRDGKDIRFRPLRKGDQFQDFYNEFCETVKNLQKQIGEHKPK
jgi:nitrogen fixation/metabolism regulation signal transduction histidine kinase